MKTVVLFAGLAVAFAACASKDASGVPRDAFMDALTAEQVTTFCAWGIQKQGGSGEHTCSWGTQTIMSIAECEAKKWPHCPLAMFEDCIDSLAGACDKGPTAECSTFAVCSEDHAVPGADAGVAPGDAG